METTLEALYQFIYHEQVNVYLDPHEFGEQTKYSSQHLKWLTENLDSEALTHLEDFRSMRDSAVDLEMYALFKATLALGLELARL